MEKKEVILSLEKDLWEKLKVKSLKEETAIQELILEAVINYHRFEDQEESLSKMIRFRELDREIVDTVYENVNKDKETVRDITLEALKYLRSQSDGGPSNFLSKLPHTREVLEFGRLEEDEEQLVLNKIYDSDIERPKICGKILLETLNHLKMYGEAKKEDVLNHVYSESEYSDEYEEKEWFSLALIGLELMKEEGIVKTLGSDHFEYIGPDKEPRI